MCQIRSTSVWFSESAEVDIYYTWLNNYLDVGNRAYISMGVNIELDIMHIICHIYI